MHHPPWVFFQAGSPCSLTIASPTPAVCTGHWGLLGIWESETLAKFSEFLNYGDSEKWGWGQG